ncbi:MULTISPECIES: cassette chromosome recombinase CcrB [Staphylococcus]|uniref:cassette chromosome recombinase CcrB n=1 Tax=Staphylococcus TaxID=1279 RepID=UPI0011100788|nr:MULTISPECIES: recombinase family protein [Staphylococcus]QCX43191.1 Cassette chromosome recombinase B [Staphylococcus aureus]QYR46480.1 recombinase family protein [Staphylococcus aureus]HDF8069756.1 recombinase family protein [Staphylococcus aureus]
MNKMKKKRIGGYIRVSTEKQVMGYSIEGQITQIEQYCQFNGYDLVDIYADRGISGKSMNRPELQRMLNDAKNGKLDCVMVYKTNRLARNTSDLLTIVEELHRQNVEFFSLSERMEVKNSTGKLMLQILASFSEFERNTILENIYTGQRQRALEGYYQGNLPLGYNNIPDNKKELMINQHEANIVKYIFESYAKGHGYRKIANALNHKGYVTKKGNPFSISAVTYILSNPFYIGKIQFAKYKDWNDKRRKGLNDKPVIAEGKHSPIIGKNLWDKVQARKKQVSKKPQVHGKGTNLLTGIVHCPQCGAPMAASNTTNTLKDGTKKRIRYYSCSNFRNKGSKVCSANSVRADVIEKYVMDQLIEIVKSDKVINQVVERVNKDNQVDIAALNHDIAYKQQQFDEINTKLKNLIQTIEDNPDLASALKPTIHQYETQLNDITNQINQLKQQQNQEKSSYDTKQISIILRHIFQNIESLDKPQLKALYLTVIDRIDIRKDGNHKKQFYVTLKLNNEIIKQLFNDTPLDEVLLSTSSLFLPQTLYLTIEQKK